MAKIKRARLSCARYADGTMTEFGRMLSWHVGDEHARRVAWVIDFYCRLARVNVTKFWGRVPY